MSKTVSEFLESFPTPLHYKKAAYSNLWVFWSQYDGSQNISYLVDRSTQMIYERIKFAFSNTVVDTKFISQFWAPVNIEGRWLLSTCGPPFAIRDLTDYFTMYRLNSAKYQYIIDGNNIDIERDPMIIRGGPATAFMSRMPYRDAFVRIPFYPDSLFQWSISIMLPICSPSRNCIGVVECTMLEYEPYDYYYYSLLNMTTALKNAGLNMLHVQELIPYHTINGLRPARDEIAKALEIVCGTHNLILAQVWIAYEDKSISPCSSSLDDTPPKKMLALKLTVSESTLKSKFKDLGIPEWPGPKLMKGKPNDPSISLIDNTNEEDNGAVQEPSAYTINKDTLTIKVDHADDMIKFHLPISQATFLTVESEIGIKFKLTGGTYKLKYLDEDGDWISLTSDEEMSVCIKSSRKSNPTVVRLRVSLSTQPISGPSGSYRICSS
ncbi:putative PB1 domain-containing protein [Helianthus annuus]|nr:putative PB1 domain-containing protein [Helianthus annuus]